MSSPDVVINEHTLVQMTYTSGTTGRQKGTMHSHESIHSVLISSLKFCPYAMAPMSKPLLLQLQLLDAVCPLPFARASLCAPEQRPPVFGDRDNLGWRAGRPAQCGPNER